MSVFLQNFHPCQTPCVLSVAPLPVLLSVPPAAIISPSPHHLFFPSICATSAIFYPYTPTHPLTSLSHSIIFLSFYTISRTSSPLSLSLTLCFSLFLLSVLVSRTRSRFLALYYLNLHTLTILLYIYLSHTLSPLCPATNSDMVLISCHFPLYSSFENCDGGGGVRVEG